LSTRQGDRLRYTAMKCEKCRFDNPDNTRFCGRCGSELSPTSTRSEAFTQTLQLALQDLTIGSTFAGRYLVIEELGKGGMGKVYKAIDKKVDEKVAVKLLNLEVAANEEVLERFRNELKLARRISHRNVCRMYDLSEAEGIPYLTMEYVSGEDLKTLMRRIGPFTVGKTMHVARQICKGLAEAHRLGVVHRDLKPQNIMIDREGNVRIMDFGIARSIEGKGITTAGVVLGTPEYMSPEQVDAKDLDLRSDIYSLGIILYEMLTGQVPFTGDTPLSVAVKQKTASPPDPRKSNDLISEALAGVILRCLEKSRDRRYQNVNALSEDLNRIAKGLPTTDRVIPEKKPSGSRKITVKFNVKKRLIPIAAAVLLIVAGFMLTKIIPRQTASLIASSKPSLAVMHFENNTGDPSLDHWRKALSDLLISDLSQSKYLVVLNAERLYNIMEDLHLMDARGYSSQTLREVADRSGVKYVLLGKMTKAGDVLRLNTTLLDAGTEEVVDSEMVEGSGEENLFAMVDELTRKIKEAFRFSQREIAGDIDKDIERITTGSPEAYKYFREGMKFFATGEYSKSIPLMELAVAIDSDLAMAYRSMASAYANLGYDSEAKKNLQKAFDLSSLVSDRERYYIQADYYRQSEKTYPQAVEAYTRLVELYPEDYIGHNNLGVIHIALEEWDKAIRQFRINTRRNAKNFQSYTNLARIYINLGTPSKAQEILQAYLSSHGENREVRELLALTFLYQDKIEAAEAEVRRVIEMDEESYRTTLLKGDIAFHKEDFPTAEQEYLKLLETEEPKAHDEGRTRLANLYRIRGRFDEAREQLEQGLELAELFSETSWRLKYHLSLAYVLERSGRYPEALQACREAQEIAAAGDEMPAQRAAVFQRGLVHVARNDWAAAQSAADELEELVEQSFNQKADRIRLHLVGLIASERGDHDQALMILNQVQSMMAPNIPERTLIGYSLALAYQRAGDDEKARLEYEKIVNLKTGLDDYGDLYAEAHYQLGNINLKRGRKLEAKKYYERFLRLWDQTDAPEVVKARRQVAVL